MNRFGIVALMLLMGCAQEEAADEDAGGMSPKPDLMVDSISIVRWDSGWPHSNGATITVGVRNAPTTEARNSLLLMRVYKDSSCTEQLISDILVMVPAVPAGEVVYVTFNNKDFPYYFTWTVTEVDCQNVVDEANEMNNVVAGIL